ncbi:superfamily II DNA/RNA helicase [uncultured archaeal virus]|uniref:DNA 3'-5' helicase n=1 Tax=uncultured archaeal virus TaxID=1960247 RepID=A0A1S5Y315_9VIRU|nr:superfamily II DNA/RNA helicase [uncultured archaeal virus]
MRVLDRRISVFKPKKGKPYRYYYVRTELGPGEVKEYVVDDQTSVFTRDELFSVFLENPYVILPMRDHVKVIVPKWIPITVGWLEFETESYKVFRVDQYAVWAGLVPDELRDELGIKPRFETLRMIDSWLVGSEEELAKAWKKYREDLLRREKGKGIRIKPGRHFSLATKLIKDGIIPWQPKPVKPRWIWKSNIVLRPYQEEAFKFWLDHGFMVLVWPMGGGKTILAIKAIEAVSGHTLIVVPNVTMVGKWLSDLRSSFVGPRPRVGVWYSEKKMYGKYDIMITTYESSSRFRREEFDLMIIDEAHHLPATSYSRLALFNTKWRLCLTGSPFREDGKTELIYALGGLPYGQDWDRLIREGWIQKPPVYVHITPSKLIVLRELLSRAKGRTLVFCDSIDMGKEASRITGLPFVYGAHSLKKRMEILNKHEKIIASRIFDEGIDVPDLQMIIEIDFLFGSRRQQLQRVGRLMHSIYDGVEYHLLMSPEEFERYRKRLYGLFAYRFNVKLVKE